jgi:hypothetical protein
MFGCQRSQDSSLGRLCLLSNELLRKFGLRCFTPPVSSPSRGGGIRAFPLDGERLDRGESLSHMPPFSSSAGERKIMNHSSVTGLPTSKRRAAVDDYMLDHQWSAVASEERSLLAPGRSE